ncbi:hypothetical protein [Brunnivagina elsteri]|uniref:hypothetical protein n=1 Tax=Brunnivagina elsteri TaxID=1247191 RepID=UPI00117741C6|nr:hypothetical protein [Calothrix elsteri]
MQENHLIFSVPKYDRVLSLLPRYLSVAQTIMMCDRCKWTMRSRSIIISAFLGDAIALLA